MHPHPEGEPLAPSGERPVALMMAGGTASGKSTALAHEDNRQIIQQDAVHIDPDEIKAMLPEYSQLVAQGSRHAAQAVHEESSQIAGRVRAEAVKRRLNIVLDGTGDSDPGKTAQKIKQLSDSGYDVHMLYVNAPTNVAIANAAQRAGRTGRWVPESEIRRQHKNVSARFVTDVQPLIGEGKVAHVRMYHNEGNNPVLMAEGHGGDMQVFEPDLFEKFIKKQEEPA
jgi:predicted ABC-type ATPase